MTYITEAQVAKRMEGKRIAQIKLAGLGVGARTALIVFTDGTRATIDAEANEGEVWLAFEVGHWRAGSL